MLSLFKKETVKKIDKAAVVLAFIGLINAFVITVISNI